MIELNEQLAELIGIISGDGFLDGKFGHYRIGIVGDPIKDKEYYEHVVKLIKKVCNKDVKIVHRERALRITFSSKELFLELTQKYDLPMGFGKCQKVTIPEIIAKDWNLAKHTIRGIADTDGSVFCANKPVAQINDILSFSAFLKDKCKDFRVIQAINSFLLKPFTWPLLYG